MWNWCHCECIHVGMLATHFFHSFRPDAKCISIHNFYEAPSQQRVRLLFCSCRIASLCVYTLNVASLHRRTTTLHTKHKVLQSANCTLCTVHSFQLNKLCQWKSYHAPYSHKYDSYFAVTNFLLLFFVIFISILTAIRWIYDCLVDLYFVRIKLSEMRWWWVMDGLCGHTLADMANETKWGQCADVFRFSLNLRFIWSGFRLQFYIVQNDPHWRHMNMIRTPHHWRTI